jgi:hypothetical protein
VPPTRTHLGSGTVAVNRTGVIRMVRGPSSAPASVLPKRSAAKQSLTPLGRQ